jgi:hypothetical protein
MDERRCTKYEWDVVSGFQLFLSSVEVESSRPSQARSIQEIGYV